MDRPTVSVVIPALNEERLLGRTLESVRREALEVIVVDGGSVDRTAALATSHGTRVLRSEPCRARQMNLGAQTARGEWLLFLHADTRLEPGWSASFHGLAPRVAGGAFRFALDSPRLVYRAIELGVALRCRLLRLPFGDQALFVRRAAFERLGGFAPLPLLEDVDLVRRLERREPFFVMLRARAITSPRRWEERGVLKTTLMNWLCLALWSAGQPAERVARIYGVRST